MPKPPAERKAAQRARQNATGTKKLELKLDQQELAMLKSNCATRRPGRPPYDMTEYIALLIRQDDARVRSRFQIIRKKRCSRCGDQLPVNNCPLKGEAACWVMRSGYELKLTV
ncbi:hypothetical protein [Erwinia sp. Leaf53]|uniref:hypothetical protein n=1 Tax=Erwinia sp. Leaf53 TaxID=1736225 RepID=UPI00070126B4|nr:hypothetical protein [Erwinia sp. Leaf53]KQN56758.1 hypothetical protein ASF13_06455 [Erwinia sp. Leaf53]